MLRHERNCLLKFTKVMQWEDIPTYHRLLNNTALIFQPLSCMRGVVFLLLGFLFGESLLMNIMIFWGGLLSPHLDPIFWLYSYSDYMNVLLKEQDLSVLPIW